MLVGWFAREKTLVSIVRFFLAWCDLNLLSEGSVELRNCLNFLDWFIEILKKKNSFIEKLNFSHKNCKIEKNAIFSFFSKNCVFLKKRKTLEKLIFAKFLKNSSPAKISYNNFFSFLKIMSNPFEDIDNDFSIAPEDKENIISKVLPLLPKTPIPMLYS